MKTSRDLFWKSVPSFRIRFLYISERDLANKCIGRKATHLVESARVKDAPSIGFEIILLSKKSSFFSLVTSSEYFETCFCSTQTGRCGWFSTAGGSHWRTYPGKPSSDRRGNLGTSSGTCLGTSCRDAATGTYLGNKKNLY